MLYVTRFSWNIWFWHLYTKSRTLCVTWRFYIQKARHFAKKKTICVTFLYQNPHTFRYAIFDWIFQIRWGWTAIFICSKKNFHNIFISKNQHTLLNDLSKKKLIICVTFLYVENNSFCVTFLYVRFIVPIYV